MIVALASAARVEAQSSAGALPGRFDLSGGAAWTGRVPLGARDASEVTGSGSAFRLFTSSTELAPAPALEVRLGVRLLRSVDVETSGSYGRPTLRTRIDNDVETSNAPLVSTMKIHQFTIGGAGVWYPARLRLSDRTRIFVRGGASFVRQVQGGKILAVDGATYEVGGGAKLLLKTRNTGRWKGIGARVDARAVLWSRAIALDNRMRTAPAIAGSLFFRF
jgi:hypothetical protein